jgi:hypothetical protein
MGQVCARNHCSRPGFGGLKKQPLQSRNASQEIDRRERALVIGNNIISSLPATYHDAAFLRTFSCAWRTSERSNLTAISGEESVELVKRNLQGARTRYVGGSRKAGPRETEFCSTFWLLRKDTGIAFCKPQGQSLKYVGVNIREEVFSHGQLYVFLSRATSGDRVVRVDSRDGI